MQERQLFEYAVLRVVPRVEREEFINVGVVLFCPGLRFLKVKSALLQDRLNAFGCEVNASDIQAYLNAFERICNGRKEGGVIGELPLASRFRWLTATRSTILQTSKVHSGFCYDPEETLSKLFAQQVM